MTEKMLDGIKQNLELFDLICASAFFTRTYIFVLQICVSCASLKESEYDPMRCTRVRFKVTTGTLFFEEKI